ncbi:MAG: hypothetical protein ACRCTZ_22570 [Sarcina sp.]
MAKVVIDDCLKFISKEIIEIKMSQETLNSITPVEVNNDFDVDKMGYVGIMKGVRIEIDDSLEFGEIRSVVINKFGK